MLNTEIYFALVLKSFGVFESDRKSVFKRGIEDMRKVNKHPDAKISDDTIHGNM